MNIASLSKTTLVVLTVFLVGCQKDPEQASRSAAIALVDEIENAQPRGTVLKNEGLDGFFYSHSERYVDSVVYDITKENSLVTPYKLTLQASYNMKKFHDRSGEQFQKTFSDAKNTTEFKREHSSETFMPFLEAEYLWHTDHNTWIPVSNTLGWPYDIEADRKFFEGKGDYYYHPKG